MELNIDGIENMTRKELEDVLKVLGRIKEPDEFIARAISYINKDLAHYNARKGQLKEQYEYDNRPY